MKFRWWLKALSIIPKISKEEWDSLDVVAKWLIMTRSAVTMVTVFSSIVAGLLAWRDGVFLWDLWLVATEGGRYVPGSVRGSERQGGSVRGVALLALRREAS